MAASKARKDRRKVSSFAKKEGTENKEEEKAVEGELTMLTPNIVSSLSCIEPLKLKDNSDIQRRTVMGRGKGLFFCPADGKGLRKGSTLLRIQPELMVPEVKVTKPVCHVCYLSNTGNEGNSGLQECLDCKFVSYCSKTCQEIDSLNHKEECRAISSCAKKNTLTNSKGDPGILVRLAARLVWNRKIRGEEWWKGIENLLVQSEETWLRSSEIDWSLGILKKYLTAAAAEVDVTNQGSEIELNKLGFSSYSLRNLLSRISCNSIEICDQSTAVLIFSLSTNAALFNHSCEPNACLGFPNGPGGEKPMHVVAIRDILPGEEIVISYIRDSYPYLERQATLQHRYSFKCQCTLCIKSEKVSQGEMLWVDPRQALVCGRGDCLGLLATCAQTAKSIGLCTECKQPYRMDEILVKATINEGKSLLEMCSTMDDSSILDQILDRAPATMKLLTAIQPPSAFPLLEILIRLQYIMLFPRTENRNMQTGTDQLTLEEAIRFATLYTQGLQSLKGSDTTKGDPRLAAGLVDLTCMLIDSAQSIEASKTKDHIDHPSVHLSRVPTIPRIGVSRIELALQTGQRALNELMICNGVDQEGGKTGRMLKEDLKILETKLFQMKLEMLNRDEDEWYC